MIPAMSGRLLWGGAAAALSAIVAGIVGISTVAAVASPADLPLTCATSGPLAGLNAAQAQNARTIVSVAVARGGTRGAVIAVMTALAESSLLILGNPNDPDGLSLPNQGIGYDHDSVGLFQQRPPWGSVAQRMDAISSTNLFMNALTDVPRWDQIDPWMAAQLTQRSAFSDGRNYRVQLPRAVGITNEVLGDPAATACDGGPPGSPPANANELGLPADFALPLGTSVKGRAAVGFALAQLGKPYVWGGVGPDGYDCSGLMQTAWQAAGVSISRVTSTQVFDGIATDAAHLAPGDLVLTPGSDGSLAAPGHVGMYIGHGLVVAAPKTGDVVRITTYASFTAKGVSFLRHIA